MLKNDFINDCCFLVSSNSKKSYQKLSETYSAIEPCSPKNSAIGSFAFTDIFEYWPLINFSISHLNILKLNITAIMSVSQIKHLMSLNFKSECILSIFCGRIADSGVDPKITIKNVKKLTKNKRNIKLLWASCRELYNIIEAEKTGCDIITVPNEILKKMKLFGKNLKSYS